MPVIRRRALAIATLSFLAWTTWYLATSPRRHDFGDLENGHYTDHFTQMNVTRLLVVAGTRIWRERVVDLLPLWPGSSKPIDATWVELPRFYPAGNHVLMAPAAIVYQTTDIGFRAANRMLIILFLFYAHVGLFFAFEHVRAVGMAALFFLYLVVIRHTLNGFYDAAVLAPLVLCSRFLADRRGLAALVAYAAAAAIHFRALYFLPWAAYAVILIVFDQQWRRWDRKAIGALAAFGLLLAASLGPFLWCYQAMTLLPVNNPVSMTVWPVHKAELFTLIIPVGAAAIFLAWCRAWLDLATLVWATWMVLRMPFVQMWYGVVLACWLAARVAVAGAGRGVYVRDVRILAWLAITLVAFGDNPLTWLPMLLPR